MIDKIDEILIIIGVSFIISGIILSVIGVLLLYF